MEVVSFKCPNCGGELVFDPNTQNYSCPYCNSEFSQEQIDTMQKGKQPSQESEAADSAKGQEQEEAVVYVCPNCGAEIVTDPTTAATECYYCQSPGGIIGKSFRKVSAPGDHSLCDRPEKSSGNLFTEYEKEEICSPWILQRKTD